MRNFSFGNRVFSTALVALVAAVVAGPYKSLETNVIPYEALERDPFQCYYNSRENHRHTQTFCGAAWSLLHSEENTMRAWTFLQL